MDFSYGDRSIRIKSLPLIQITIVLYEEDIEFPPSAEIFFDESIKNYLDLELIGMLSELILYRLKQAFQYLNKNSE